MEITRPLFVGRSLIINILGASLFWYLAKVFIVPKWVATSFDRLIWPFLWNGKTETVKQSVLYNPLPKGGLRMIHFRTKCKSLLVSNLSPFLESSRKCKWHYFAQYYLGRRLASLNTRWASFASNLIPNALLLPVFYKDSLDALIEILTSGSFQSSAKKCYEFFIRKVTEPPTRTYDDWRDLVGPNFNWPNLWKLVRNKTAENKNNDFCGK